MSYIAQHYIFNEEVAFSLNEKTKKQQYKLLRDTRYTEYE